MTTRELLNGLRRRFSGRFNTIQTRDDVLRLPAPALHSHWIVSRALCLYRREDFTAVPANRRRSALQLKLSVWSPFKRTGYHCVWSDTVAMTWFWDEEVVGASAVDGEGERPADLRTRPETVFYPRKEDGVHLQTCREGFELQYWRADILEDSYWLAASPGEEEIDAFRSRGVVRRALGERRLAPSPANLAAEPWSSPLTASEWVRGNERRLAAFGLVAVALVSSWQEARIWNVVLEDQGNVDQLARMQDRLGPFLDTREQVRQLRRHNELLAGFHNEPSQAYVMGLVDQAIPDDEARFRAWHYQQGELRLVLEGANIDPVAYVGALEELFDQVELGRSQRSGRIEIVLRVGV